MAGFASPVVGAGTCVTSRDVGAHSSIEARFPRTLVYVFVTVLSTIAFSTGTLVPVDPIHAFTSFKDNQGNHVMSC